MLLLQRGHVETLDVFHHQIVNAPYFAGIEGLHDVGMLQLADGFHLAAEPRHRLGIVHSLGREQLHRHNAVEHRMRGFVNGAHPALADLFEQVIFANAADRHGAIRPAA